MLSITNEVDPLFFHCAYAYFQHYHVRDPRALKCHGCNDEFQKRHPMVDDRVLDIVKRIGLKGLHRTLSREIDHNLITAFVER